MKATFSLVVCVLALHATAQNYAPGFYLRTIAGSQLPGYVNAQGAQARFYYPSFQAADTASNLYVWDWGNHAIRKITPAHTVTTAAATSSLPLGMVFAPDGQIWSLARNGSGYELDSLSTNGSWQSYPVSFASVLGGDSYLADGFCVDSAGRFYTSIKFQLVRFDRFGGVSVFADGSHFVSSSYVLTCDANDNIYAADWGGSIIRKIDPAGNVTMFAGFTRAAFPYYPPNADGPLANATFFGIIDMVPDGLGGLYLVVAGTPYSFGTAIRHINGGIVTTLAGSFFDPLPFSPANVFVNGAGNQARFFGAFSMCKVGERLLVSDSWNNCIREVSTNVYTAGNAASLTLTMLDHPTLAVTGDAGSVQEILTSPDLINWSVADALLITNAPSLWRDLSAVNGTMFYRTIAVQ